MGFADSVSATATKMQKQVNDKAIEIASDLFNTVVTKTPVGESKTRGQLINNWWTAEGVGNYNTSYSPSFNTSGTGSYSRIAALKDSQEFIGKDGAVSLTNSVPYAYRAEYFGWNFSAPEPRWRGTAPYAMVRNSLTAIAAKYKGTV